MASIGIADFQSKRLNIQQFTTRRLSTPTTLLARLCEDGSRCVKLAQIETQMDRHGGEGEDLTRYNSISNPPSPFPSAPPSPRVGNNKDTFIVLNRWSSKWVGSESSRNRESASRDSSYGSNYDRPEMRQIWEPLCASATIDETSIKMIRSHGSSLVVFQHATSPSSVLTRRRKSEREREENVCNFNCWISTRRITVW